MQEYLAVAVSQATIDGVAAHDRDDVGILFGFVFPKDLALIVQVERKDRIGERSMDVHDVADHQRPAFMSTQDAGRKRPRHLQFGSVRGGDLVEFGITMVGVVAGRRLRSTDRNWERPGEVDGRHRL
jgi:hypothetical protein